MNVINKYIVLVSAIKEKRLVTFLYHGLNRTVQCATLGYTPSGNAAVRAYQIKGSTNSGNVPCWSLFSIGDIHQLVLTEDKFCGVPPSYKKSDPAFSRIDAEL